MASTDLAQQTRAPGQALRVLVVDSQHNRKATVSLLESCDYKVTAVSTAKEAFAVLKEDPAPPFDLLLKDHDPAGGVNACRMLAKLKNTAWANLPVVVCSDHDSRVEVLKCVNLGAADYLVKPLRRNEIRNLWTRVPSLRWAALFSENGAKAGGPDAADLNRTGADQGNPTDSAGTVGEEDDNPTSKEGSAPGVNGNSSQLHAKGAHGSNGNGNGSNGNGASATTPAHGSHNGHGASTMHVYAGGIAINGDSPAAARPILYATHDGSGGGSGDGGQDGSGQGSGSGNRASQSAVACGLAGEYREPHDPAKLGSSDAVGSSAVRAAPPPAVTVPADRQRTQPSQTAAAAVADADAAARQAGAVWSAQIHHEQQQELQRQEAPSVPGFRAWVSPAQKRAAARDIALGASVAASGAQASNGARPPSSGADCQTAPSPSAGAGSAAVPATVGSAAAAPSERFGSGATVGTGNGTGGSTGTQIAAGGDASTQGGSTAATPQQQLQPQQLQQQQQSAAGPSQGAAPPQLRLLPRSGTLQPPPQQTGGTAAAAQAQAQAQQQHQQHHHQHQQQRSDMLKRDAAAAAQWASAHGAAAQLHRMQQHQQQIMSSFAGSAALGALPPHMMPSALNPFAMGPPQPLSRDDMPLPYGEHHLMQNGAQRMQAQQQAVAAKQAEMQQQLGAAMMASYPGYMLAPYGMASFPGMRPPTGWPLPPSAQQAQQMMQHVHASQQQQRPPQFAQSSQTPAPHPGSDDPRGAGPGAVRARHLGGGAMSAPVHGMKGVPIPGLQPRQAGTAVPRLMNGSNSTFGAPAGSAGTGLTTTGPGSIIAGEPSRSERRAQALHKYKQKRKNLCFTKKIRYESRKQLAQARPRVKGQFVRMSSGGVEAAEAGVEPVARVVTVASVELAPGGPSPGETAPLTQLMPETRTSADGEEDGEYDKDGCEFDEDEDMAVAEDEEDAAPAAAPLAPALEQVEKAEPSPKVTGSPLRTALLKTNTEGRRNGGRNGSDSGSNSPEPEEDGAEA